MKSEHFEKECQLLKLITETKAYVVKKIKEKAYSKLGVLRTAIVLMVVTILHYVDNPNTPISHFAVRVTIVYCVTIIYCVAITYISQQ